MSKKCTPLWCEAHFQVKMYKALQSTTCSRHFWRFGCGKSACRCGAKHILKSKCTKHTLLGPLLEVEMSKKCTPLWREAHFQVKMYKALQSTTCSRHFWRFGCGKSARRCGAKHISKSKCTKHTSVGPPLWKLRCRKSARRCGVKIQNIRGLDHFWRFRCRFASRHYTTGHYTTLHSSTLHYTPLHTTTLHYTTLHPTTLHYTTTTQLHSTTLHCAKLHYTTLHYMTLHYTTLHCITLHYIAIIHYTTLHYTALHYIPLHSTTLHYTTLQYTTLH